ncbi:NAD(P)-binding domain-containing protein [uncultured Methanobrevibacter sp.]|uniref:NAD(P)-binding domain-containing protein n=1 Tax=uncultured Methanobrevibacter sp. TaxID=253161 RepID=UPI00261C55E9
MKLGLIGYGNVGSLITNNILKLNLLLDDEELFISNRNKEKIEHLKSEYPDANISITDDNKTIAENCDKILICVETPQFKNIIDEISPFIKKNIHIIYTCAGIDLNQAEKIYDGKLSVVIPTIASSVTSNNTISSLSRRKGYTLIKHNKKVELEERLYLEDFFNEFSYVRSINNNVITADTEDIVIINNELEISTVLTSYGPAIAAMIVDKFAYHASIQSNLSKKEAEEMIIRTMLATSILMDNQKLSSEEIIKKVTTHGRLNQDGIDLLDKKLDKSAKDLMKILLNKYEELKTEIDENEYF